MRLAAKIAGLCGSGVFTVALLTAVFRQLEPWYILLTALPAGLLAGSIGYTIGKILSNPKGRARHRQARSKQPDKPAAPPITGNETFLSDLAPSESASTREPRASSSSENI